MSLHERWREVVDDALALKSAKHPGSAQPRWPRSLVASKEAELKDESKAGERNFANGEGS